MDKKTLPLSKIGELIKKSGSLGLIAVIVILGVILLLLPSGEKKAPETKPPEITPEVATDTVESFERRLTDALSKIEDAGRVTVVLSLQSDGETYFVKDREYSEKTGESREQNEETVIVSSGSSVQAPVVVKHGYPEYRGALVVAEGAGDATVKLAIIQAVSALTGLGTDRVTVVKMQTN